MRKIWSSTKAVGESVGNVGKGLLGENAKIEDKDENEEDDELHEAMEFFCKHTGSIEILWDDEVYKVNFPILSHFQFLNKVTIFLSLLTF